ncbi:hypothetical protein [Cardiobacterium valvarum]|nr:hypothetical protein [Cardiobacterium valvarum]
MGDDYALGDDTGHLPLVHPGDETAALLATYTHGSYRYYHQP